MIVLGADPGFSGAVASFGHGSFGSNRPRLLGVYDLLTVGDGAQRRIDVEHLFKHLQGLGAEKAYVEYATDMRAPAAADGSRARNANMGRYMRGVGHLEATIVCAGADLFAVMPAVWKKFFGLIGERKNSSIEVAVSLCPEAREWLPQRTIKGRVVDVQKYHNRAEAILLAVYGACRQGLISLERDIGD